LEIRAVDIAGIREVLHRQPFEPFAMRLADGRSLEVKHPDFVALTPRRIVVIADDEVGSWSIIEPILIVSLDSISKPAKGGNGSHGKKPKR
jgi:hypothetical protein